MKNTAHRLLNLALFLSFSGMVGTGLLIAWKLPPGREGGHGLTIWGLSRHEWGDVHLYLSFAVVALLIAHLALNWRWLRQIAARRRMWRLAAGLAAGLAIVGAFLLAPVVRTPPHSHPAATDEPKLPHREHQE